MARRTKTVVALIALLVGVAGACSDDSVTPSPMSEFDGAIARVTVSPTDCSIASDGFVYPPGRDVEVEFLNETDVEVTLSLIGEGATPPTFVQVVAPQSSQRPTIAFPEAGRYTLECDPAPGGGRGGAIFIED